MSTEPAAQQQPTVTRDVEISSMSEDRLGRVTFSRRVSERIRLAADGPSVVFGLAGPWGSGKSSVLNMITEILSEEFSDNWVVASFTPWSAGDSTELTNEFYRAIAGAMPTSTDEGRTARRLLRAAAPTVAAVGKAALASIIDSKFGEGSAKDMLTAASDTLSEQIGDAEFGTEPEPFQEQFRRISAAIAETSRNVLVIVDDIDRLHADELLSVMRAVRLLGRFDRVHYLLSYDQRTVIDILTQTEMAGKSDRRRARDYLEKIVQYPFTLPPIQQAHLAEHFREQFCLIGEIHGFDPALRTEGQRLDAAETVFEILLEQEHLTLRRIYRLCNQIDVMLSLIDVREIDLVDAAILTDVRLNHPDLYNRLPAWQADLQQAEYGLSTDTRVQPETWTTRFAEFSQVNRDSPEMKEIYRSIATMFPNMTRPARTAPIQRDAARGIRNRDYFERYFAFEVPIRDVRDVDVSADLRALVNTENWSEDSLIRAALLEFDMSQMRLIRNKILIGQVISETYPSENFTRAAVLITQAHLSNPESMIHTGWAEIVYLLLGRAVTEAEDLNAACASIDLFSAQCGLGPTVDAMARPVAAENIDEEAVLLSADNVRAALVDTVMRDLTVDLPRSEWPDNSVLRYVHWKDDEVWSSVQEKTLEAINSGSLRQEDVAARFVSISPESELNQHVFNNHEYELVIPREKWDLTQFSSSDSDVVDFDDTSIQNRKIYAAQAIRSLLQKADSAT
ncbi:hypothetical protein GTC6_04440 [Gordonia terrae C-6]|uniref:KAP NTPase domain-containing protein n=2 Tax=Gordonia terrae TaxID=2055 RepID=R7YDY2_9ACTN|nr:hypothetical protein GTC6_04440 [Gordonia terrae C-6]